MNDIFKALSHPVRRDILALLRDGPVASGEIAAGFDMRWPTVTAHLNVLRAAGLIEAERVGTSVRYRLMSSAAEDALGLMMELFGQLATKRKKTVPASRPGAAPRTLGGGRRSA